MKFYILFLFIEFLDELIGGSRDAAWPYIRDDLGLDYIQIGLLLGIPAVVSNLLEPVLGILADTWKRRFIILSGGFLFILSLVLTGFSINFFTLLGAMIIFYPASGAFVSVSQAALMDMDPDLHEQNMAKWTFAGAAGVFIGPLLLSLFLFAGFSWRALFIFYSVFALFLLLKAWSHPGLEKKSQQKSFYFGIKKALKLLKNIKIVRWLLLLQCSDLMLDVLLGFLALYFVDVAGISGKYAPFAVAVWTGVGLIGDFLLIPLLKKIKGLTYLRLSVLIELVLYPFFLLAPDIRLKLVLIGLIGFFNAGWYSILKAQLYSALPARSGTVLALTNVSNIFGAFLLLGLGYAAERVGLSATMWLLLAGPLVLLVGLNIKVKGGNCQ